MEGMMHRRTRCPACGGSAISKGMPPHVNLRFPLLPVCVDTPRDQDVMASFTISMCEGCGLIMLLDAADPEALYKIFHSDGIGKVWEGHYDKFAKLIFKHAKGGRLLEIGAGQGKLMKKLLGHYGAGAGLEVIDPQYEGPADGVKVHGTHLNPEFAEENAGKFASVVSSHTLEHFIDFNDYFADSWKCLEEGGMLFTSVPNQEFNFAKGYGNQLNFEHPSACTNQHWLCLHYKNGFEVREVSFYSDHSVMIAAQKARAPIPYALDAKGLSEKILAQYGESIKTRIAAVRERALPDRENWLFGASNFSQPLFVYGLEEGYFAGVLDNSPLKHNKRLYGTSLICRKPEEIIEAAKSDANCKRLRVFLNIGQYNAEVEGQLHGLDAGIETVLL